MMKNRTILWTDPYTKGHELGDGINAEAQRDGRSAKWFEDRARMEKSTIPLTDPYID